jgi:ribosomal protein S18 acetylase RimI-like enzyme
MHERADLLAGGVTLAPFTTDDRDFAFHVTEATMRTYVEQAFGHWDANDQRRRSDENDHSICRLIMVDGVRAGILVVDDRPDEIFLARVFVLPAFQRHGIGSTVIRSLMARADSEKKPLRLRVLCVNPARRLYDRLGFAVTQQTPERFYMEYRGRPLQESALIDVKADLRTDDVILRAATPRDAYAVAEVYLGSRRAFLPFAPPAHSDDDVRQHFASDLIPGGSVTAAVAGGGDGPLVGMMAVSLSAGVGWIDQLYLLPSAVRRGIGTRLLEQAKSELGSPIRLYTFQANHDARRFYERHGFRIVAFGDGSKNEERCPDVLYEWVISAPRETA